MMNLPRWWAQGRLPHRCGRDTPIEAHPVLPSAPTVGRATMGPGTTSSQDHVARDDGGLGAAVRILIADVDAFTRLLVQRSLEPLGHQCIVASDGAAAWSMVQQGKVDVVVS